MTRIILRCYYFCDYLKKKCEPEIHPVSHLYPVELSLTHEYRIPLPSVDNLPVESAPDPDVNNEVNNDAIIEPDLQGSANFTIEADGLIVANDASPSDFNEPSSVPPIQLSRRGRHIKPPKAHADFLPFE